MQEANSASAEAAVEEFMALLKKSSEERAGILQRTVAEPLSSYVPGFSMESLGGAYPLQGEGRIGDYFYYLRGEDGILSIALSLDQNDLHVSPELYSSMEVQGNLTDDLQERILNLLDTLQVSERLYYFPSQPRWNAAQGFFSEYGDGELMVGPWYPKGVYEREDGSTDWIVSNCQFARGIGWEDALEKLLDPDKNFLVQYRIKNGDSREEALRLHSLSVEALEVGSLSFGYPLNEVKKLPSKPPKLLSEAVEMLRGDDGKIHLNPANQ